jgi:chromosome segregation ATPase
MSEEVAKYETKVKREPVTVRLLQDTIILGRSLARTLYGSEDKLGNLIDESINYFSAHRENDSRTNALLKTTENILFQRFTEQVETMYKSFTQRDNKLTERIAGLLAVSSFETALAESMLKDLYCRDERTKERYEELRSLSAKKMKDRYEKANVGEVLELQQKVRSLEKQLGETNDALSSTNDELEAEKAKNAKLSKQLQNVNTTASEYKTVYEKSIEALKAFDKVVKWYEMRETEIPLIQKKNKTLMKKQDYEEAMKEFDSKNRIPYRPELKYNNNGT